MPFGSKYSNKSYEINRVMFHNHDRPAGEVNIPSEEKKPMKSISDYDDIRNTVMESGEQKMHNVSQTVSKLKKPMPKSRGYKR